MASYKLEFVETQPHQTKHPSNRTHVRPTSQPTSTRAATSLPTAATGPTPGCLRSTAACKCSSKNCTLDRDLNIFTATTR
ncbi:hypothetical protein BCR33DRAFT_473486 [Rhizoclosmatium globosum]|uniref:Uncharacterized protein n=1 Tax=Rhizoclosmatium globosum TaxID=329046 RepID=A0A1Y2BQ81_9FUNG|nr:hypothetical protein BCR33DRAFT_473486 [Rhizoclosmatium globosum]|eukprot:ORY36904.1 hypothetical protein BCR33DRAFT_473486 [Rhizoclosmatium globosum]